MTLEEIYSRIETVIKSIQHKEPENLDTKHEELELACLESWRERMEEGL